MIIPSPSENTSVLACEKRLERKIKWNAVRDAELLARSERVLGKSLSSSKVSEIDEVSSTCDDKPFNMGNGFMNTPVVRKKLRPPSTISATLYIYHKQLRHYIAAPVMIMSSRRGPTASAIHGLQRDMQCTHYCNQFLDADWSHKVQAYDLVSSIAHVM